MFYQKNKLEKNNKKGFTLVELLIIVAIIAMLASVILVSLHSAQVKAGDNSAFTSIKSTASSAYMCLLSGAPGMKLSTPSDASLPSICMNGSVPLPGYSSWPSLIKTKWSYGDGSSSGEGFFWCAPLGASSSSCGGLADGSCGQSSASGTFCYGFKHGAKTIWCTSNGCIKSGF